MKKWTCRLLCFTFDLNNIITLFSSFMTWLSSYYDFFPWTFGLHCCEMSSLYIFISGSHFTLRVHPNVDFDVVVSKENVILTGVSTDVEMFPCQWAAVTSLWSLQPRCFSLCLRQEVIVGQSTLCFSLFSCRTLRICLVSPWCASSHLQCIPRVSQVSVWQHQDLLSLRPQAAMCFHLPVKQSNCTECIELQLSLDWTAACSLKKCVQLWGRGGGWTASVQWNPSIIIQTNEVRLDALCSISTLVCTSVY